MSDTKSQIKEAQRTPCIINSKNLHRGISSSNQIKSLKEVRGKTHLPYRGTNIRTISDFSKIMQVGREGMKYLKY